MAPVLVSRLLYVDRPPGQQQLMVEMVRLMMVTPLIFSVSGLIMGILQSYAAFWLPAIAISMNNIGIIIGALVIAPALPAHPGVGQVGDLNVMGASLWRRLERALAPARAAARLVQAFTPVCAFLLSLRIPGVA